MFNFRTKLCSAQIVITGSSTHAVGDARIQSSMDDRVRSFAGPELGQHL